MHHIICSAAPNHQLIDSMINLIRHVTEPGEYSSPARTERTSPAKNTAAYPAVARRPQTTAPTVWSWCRRLLARARAHTHTPLGLRALPAECASVARANLQPPTNCRRSQLTTSLSSQQATKNISAWKACMFQQQQGKSPYGLLVVCCYLFCSANFYCYG